MSAKRGPGQAWWASHLDAIAREGIDATAYAKREGLAVSNLYYWRRFGKLWLLRCSNAPGLSNRHLVLALRAD